MNKNLIDIVINELTKKMNAIDMNSLEEIVPLLLNTKNIFVAGVGRSGLIAKCFAMRLTQLDLHVSVVGEVTSKAIEKEDILILSSNSGKTEALLPLAKKATESGAKIILFTSNINSILASLSHTIILIPTKKDKLSTSSDLNSGFQPMGTLFEQCLLLTLDIFIMLLMEGSGLDEHFIQKHHANLELL